MPAGGTDGAPRDEHARTRQQSLRNAVAQSPIGAARVAHGREAAIDHRAHEARRADGHHRKWNGFELLDIHLREHRVNVAIDEAGHQRPPLQSITSARGA
jgi:hypothetical protein